MTLSTWRQRLHLTDNSDFKILITGTDTLEFFSCCSYLWYVFQRSLTNLPSSERAKLLPFNRYLEKMKRKILSFRREIYIPNSQCYILFFSISGYNFFCNHRFKKVTECLRFVAYISNRLLCTGGDDDEEEGAVVLSKKLDDKPVITPKWPTRVFAMECIRLILDVCKSHEQHTNLALARKIKDENSSGKS